ncbi:glycosyltransferase family 4 protein [Mycetocola miduiensis]|uniref:D-inositol 3-phosphate glycosyltransferase n=1 Tax=Mycetocola miduiensis TaxID=995034 RepID=A0A1I5DZN7_9MICO|nr:glycosyltransferase family 4 protein [Mycetocola miduiensis]SFO04744.1 Glycosyltransferase involved in cell wall bisynthesis [Mycetocola miduiensis]
MNPNDQVVTPAHVLFVVNNYPPSVGGVETHVLHLASEIAASGSRATIVTLAEAASDRVEGNVRVVRLRRHFPVAGVISFPAPGASKRIAKAFGNDQVTTVSTHTRFFPMSAVGARVAKRIAAPVIHTEHGSDFVRSSSPMVSIASRFVDLTVGRWVLRNADVVLGVSEQVVAFVGKLAGVRAKVFYNAIDITKWSNVTVDPTTNEVPRFCFLGRLVAGKGWDDLLEAATQIRQRKNLDRFRIDIMGDGPDRLRLESRVASLGLDDVVRVHGQVPPQEVRDLLSGGVLVNPTVLSEGFQTTLLEAIAVGGQIVSYPVPGIDQLIADGVPVRKVRAGDTAALAIAMEAVALRPRPVLDPSILTKWSWDERGREYLRVVAGLRSGNR